MFKSILLVLLIGTAAVMAEETINRDAWGFIVDNIIDPFVETVIDNTVNLITGAILGLFGKRDAWGFIVDNIIDPFVETVIDNTVNLITGAILGLFGKRDAWGFIVDNIIDPFVETVIDNTVNLITGAILGLFGKRDAWGFIVDNIIDPFVETVIDNTVNLITGAILGLFGKRDAWGFIVDNIIDPFVETVIDNTVNLITGAILGLFGKRGLDLSLTQVLQPLLHQFLPGLIQSTLNAINHLITSILPLMKQEALHLPGPATHVGIVKALTQLDEEMKINVQFFLSHVINAASVLLNNVHLNQLVTILTQIVHVFLNLSQYIEPIINQIFVLLSKPIVGQLVGQILG